MLRWNLPALRRFVLGLVTLGLLAGCAAVSPAPVPTQDGPLGRTLRVGYSTELDFADLPSVLALPRLEAQGYTVERIHFAGADLAASAVAQGQIDIGIGSMRTYWAARAQGGAVVTLMEHSGNVWTLVARREITGCADLQGRRSGISSTGSLNAALLNAYILANCPGTTPELLIIANSTQRAAALVAGELDATGLELTDWYALQQSEGDTFHALANYGADLPGLAVTGVHAHRSFAADHPGVVQDYLAALLTVHREIAADPTPLIDLAVSDLAATPEEAATWATLYLDANIWDANGTLTPDIVARTLAFFADTGSLDPSLTPEDVADLRYLDEALTELGRQ